MSANRIRILLIEDNPGDARLIGHMLDGASQFGYELVWEDSLAGGVGRLRQEEFGVVLLDLVLPGSSGLETLHRLQEQVPQAPALVVLSGLSDEDVAMRAVQSGAQDYLIKGQVDNALLVRAIRYAIERAQAQEALQRAHADLERRVVERTAELAQTVDALHAEVLAHKEAEELLRKRELEFRTLAEHSPDMVIRYDRDCRCFYVNPAYEKKTGVPAANALNKVPDERWRSETPDETYQDALRRVIDTGMSTEIFVHGTGVKAGPVDYAFHLVPERDPDGKVAGVLAIGRNVTALREAARRLKESQSLLRRLVARNEAVLEEERRRLRREIHDELGQYLSALRMGVSVIGLQFGEQNPALNEKTQNLVKLVDSTIKVVRNVVSSLRPVALDMGIQSALEWLVEEFIARTRIPCTLRVYDGNVSLDEKRATEIFRIVQESLTNISRHADATEVEVMLERDSEQYLLSVRDNGVGFDPAVRKDKSFGLIGIRERALMLGGEVNIASAPEQGTVITVRFPTEYNLAEQ